MEKTIEDYKIEIIKLKNEIASLSYDYDIIAKELLESENNNLRLRVELNKRRKEC